MASQEYPAPTSDRGAQPSRARLRAFLRTTNGRLVLVAYVSVFISIAILLATNWRHPQPFMLAAYKAASVLWMFLLLVLALRFLWLLPIWAHLIWTLGCVSLFLSAIYWPLVTGGDGPLNEALTNLA